MDKPAKFSEFLATHILKENFKTWQDVFEYACEERTGERKKQLVQCCLPPHNKKSRFPYWCKVRGLGGEKKLSLAWLVHLTCKLHLILKYLVFNFLSSNIYSSNSREFSTSWSWGWECREIKWFNAWGSLRGNAFNHCSSDFHSNNWKSMKARLWKSDIQLLYCEKNIVVESFKQYVHFAKWIYFSVGRFLYKKEKTSTYMALNKIWFYISEIKFLSHSSGSFLIFKRKEFLQDKPTCSSNIILKGSAGGLSLRNSI